MPRSKWLPLALLLCALCADSVCGIRIYKSRRKAMATLSGVSVDSQQYFSSCETSNGDVGCDLATDNEFSQEWTQCATTEVGTKSWWRGHLENPMYVTTVYILNADWDRVGDRDGLLEFTIGGNGHVCYTHRGSVSFSSKTFPCDIMASDIQISSLLSDVVLALCDVQVFGALLKFPTVLERAPIVKFDDCSTSSTQKSRYCWHAYDDYLDQKADTGACAMTNPNTFEWWKGVFALPALVQEVIIYNRDDCCQQELTNFAITISSRICYRYNNPKTFSIESFKCNVFGGDIKIQLMTQEQLTLCEVKVFGHSVEMLPEQKRTFLGCYIDKKDDPDLSDIEKDPVSLTTMHTNKCDRQCRRRKAKYFGLQQGNQCWCANTYGRHGMVNNTQCGKECEGKRKEYCGNDDRNLIYQLNY